LWDTHHGWERKETCILVRKPVWKTPYQRQRHRWEDNIKMDLKKIGCEGVSLIELNF
jgi:hypothetical protein